MSKTGRIVVVLALGLLAAPLAAEEILHFKSGSALPVVSYEIRGDMVHVDLGDNGFMAFPLANLDSVEKAGQNVVLEQSTQRASGSSVMRVAPSPEGDFPVKAEMQTQQKNRNRFEDQETDYDPAIEIDERGVAVYRPMSTSQQAAKRELAFSGNRRVRQNSGTPGAYRGARQVGTKQVIGPIGPRRSNNDAPAPAASPMFERRTGGPPTNPGSTDSSGSSSDTPTQSSDN